jgi:hypothetical protein
LAMMHLAMHDAVNGTVPRYRQYTRVRSEPHADPVLAAAQAAHEVLAHEYPTKIAAFDAELDRWLAQRPHGPSRRRAAELGDRAAAAILARRANDGWNRPAPYEFDSAPGKYRTTPPWDGFVLTPGLRFARPFFLRTPSELRPAPPPALASYEYAIAFDEVKRFGRADSSARTADQSRYAIWWMEFTETSVNRLARELVAAEHMDLWRAARLFALLNMAQFDTYVAVWDAKYEYNHWRPYSAIREAGVDGNPATTPDSGWEPLRPTPPFPEYASAHGAACACTFGVLAQEFGDDMSFVMQTLTAPPEMPTRSFEHFSDAASECADSRIRLGWHFRYAADGGLELGKRIAGLAAERQLRPRHHQ